MESDGIGKEQWYEMGWCEMGRVDMVGWVWLEWREGRKRTIGRSGAMRKEVFQSTACNAYGKLHRLGQETTDVAREVNTAIPTALWCTHYSVQLPAHYFAMCELLYGV